MNYAPTFAERLDRSRRFYAYGVESALTATAKGHALVIAPAGYSRGERASWSLGAAHQRRDTVGMCGNGSGPSMAVGQVRRRRREALDTPRARD